MWTQKTVNSGNGSGIRFRETLSVPSSLSWLEIPPVDWSWYDKNLGHTLVVHGFQSSHPHQSVLVRNGTLFEASLSSLSIIHTKTPVNAHEHEALGKQLQKKSVLKIRFFSSVEKWKQRRLKVPHVKSPPSAFSDALVWSMAEMYQTRVQEYK